MFKKKKRKTDIFKCHSIWPADLNFCLAKPGVLQKTAYVSAVLSAEATALLCRAISLAKQAFFSYFLSFFFLNRLFLSLFHYSLKYWFEHINVYLESLAEL